MESIHTLCPHKNGVTAHDAHDSHLFCARACTHIDQSQSICVITFVCIIITLWAEECCFIFAADCAHHIYTHSYDYMCTDGYRLRCDAIDTRKSNVRTDIASSRMYVAA